MKKPAQYAAPGLFIRMDHSHYDFRHYTPTSASIQPSSRPALCCKQSSRNGPLAKGRWNIGNKMVIMGRVDLAWA